VKKKEQPIRLVLLDGHALFRVGLGRFLSAEPGIDVVGECGHSAQALKLLSASPVDIVLLDFNLDEGDAEEFMVAARRAGYRGRFLIITANADPKTAAIALRLGASGILLKSDDPDQLQGVIPLVMKGGVWLDQQVAQLLIKELVDLQPRTGGSRKVTAVLTDRQNKVLLGISRGLTNRTIGNHLGLSEGSIKSVVQQLFYKAGVRTRSLLVRAALDGSLGATADSTKRSASARTQVHSRKSRRRK
jgi:DNA-binding NarL/FixJ family response regulator